MNLFYSIFNSFVYVAVIPVYQVIPSVLPECFAAEAVGEAGGPAESGQAQDPRAVAGSAATRQEERRGGVLRRGRRGTG